MNALMVIVVAVGFVLVVNGLLALPVMWMWNYATPQFGWPPLTFGKALCLLTLVAIFGSYFRQTSK